MGNSSLKPPERCEKENCSMKAAELLINLVTKGKQEAVPSHDKGWMQGRLGLMGTKTGLKNCRAAARGLAQTCSSKEEVLCIRDYSPCPEIEN